ncbi:16541_t:CDS:2 [Entrophospora sp. SA101]|nr:16541_t:CDS:2 [Entrophospora sp. SA101]
MSKTEIVEHIISETLTEAYQIKIKKHTTLPLHELITPSVNVRTIKNPRPQNSFVIYRRNVQAEIAKEKGTNAAGKLDYVSKYAADKWRQESQEVKDIYGLLANCAKKVHDIMYPGYVYQPKRQATTNEPMIMVHEPSINGVGYKLRPSSSNSNSNNNNNGSGIGIPINNSMMNNSMNTMIPNNPNIPTPPETPLPSPPAQRPISYDRNMCKAFDVTVNYK